MICNIKYIHYIKENEKKFIETLTELIEGIYKLTRGRYKQKKYRV